MTSSRKQLRIEIDRLKKILQQQQNQMVKHENLIKTTANHHQMIYCSALLFSSFLGGWIIGRRTRINQLCKNIIELSYSAVIAYFKNQIINIFINNFK